jgi:ATP-dependent helicase/DNAse subunit B
VLLLTGPAGSGKTDFILEQFRQALRAGNTAVRLLAPTATLARHLQNRIAREGFVYRGALIQTLSGFVETWASALPQAPDAVLSLIVEEAVTRVGRQEFARVAQIPGFCGKLAETIAEFSAAGCDSARLAAALPRSPFGAAFLAVYRQVDRELERRGLALRAKRLEYAAARIENEGLNDVRTIWLDGFHTLPDPELKIVGALARHAKVTLTLSATDATESLRARLRAIGFDEERASGSRPPPAMELVKAPGIERETEEIARRILEQSEAGRAFREMGIIVRATQVYVPILRATLERFGIPAHYYFDQNLEQHPVTRFLAGAVDAMLAGWDHAQTLAVLRLAPRFAASNTMDRFDFAVREQIPNSGLASLRALLLREDGQPRDSGSERLGRLIDALADLEEWRGLSLAPAEWASRLKTLRALFRPARPPEPADHELALVWRSQAAALNLFDEALGEAGQALDSGRPTGLTDFWRAVKAVLRLKPLRLPDRRRNAVHVLSAPEARQWSLPVVFVCGLVEKQFPQFHSQDPFFSDAARSELNAAGIRVRTAAEFEREERALFDSAITRATECVTLSYPEFDARGDRALPSLLLDGLDCKRADSRPARPQPRNVPAARGLVSIRDSRQLESLREKTASVSPSALEKYLQCPFQFFSNQILRLKRAPSRPEERLDYAAQGTVAHQVLAEYARTMQPIEPLFERVFEEYCNKNEIRAGYRTERLRQAMLADVLRFAEDSQWPLDSFQSQTEERFDFPMSDSLQITGKIDRLDRAPDGRAYVIDYKYSAAKSMADKLDDTNLLQAPIYLIAAEQQFGLKPAGMFFVGIKGGIKYAGWCDGSAPGSVQLQARAFPENWLAQTKERVLQALAEIRGGRVEPFPSNTEKCRFCDYGDVCRVATTEPAVSAESA